MIVPTFGQYVFDGYSLYCGHCKCDYAPICNSKMDEELWNDSEKWILESKGKK